MRHPLLDAIAEEYRTLHRRLAELVRSPRIELEILMAAIDELKALEPRLDAIAAAIGTDTATAVAAAVAPLNEQITTLTAAAAQTEADTSAEAGVLSTKIGVIETNVGITAPTPPADPSTAS